MRITAVSHAKVNLFLRIVGKRANGYHEIRSVFQKVSLADTLIFTTNHHGAITLNCDDPELPRDRRNLVIKVAEALRNQVGSSLGADISLEKKIPVAAGLGGGSGNAAVTLQALAGIWGVDATFESLANLALSIGADVPFFLDGPCAFVSGIGEKVSQLSPKKSFPILIVKPDFGISAADAYKYSRFDFAPFEKSPEMVEDIESGEPARAAKWMINDLEPWALEAYPKLAALKEKVEKTGPLRAMMSGSGSALFAVYETPEKCQGSCDSLKGAAPFVTMAQTVVNQLKNTGRF